MKIFEKISELDVGNLASELVKIQSGSFMDSQEEEIAAYICEWLTGHGIETEIYEVEKGRPNVVARIRGREGPSLLLTGHTDTVPAYDMEDAFSGRNENGMIYGRGTTDMKGALAAMMVAMAAIKKSEIDLEGDLWFAAVVDEEEQGKGTKALISNWCGASATIVGEPTSMNIALGNKGLEWININVFGRKVHGSAQKDGINAIAMASRFITYLYDAYVPEILEKRNHPVLGNPTVNIGKICGGDQPSTVADLCSVQLDRRAIPGETIDQVYRELHKIFEIMKEKYPGFEAEAKDMFEGQNDLPHLPFYTDGDVDIVKAIQAAAKSSGLHERELTVCHAWTDAGFIANNTDSDCVIMGPGDITLAHSINEAVSVDELEDAARIYAATALEYCL